MDKYLSISHLTYNEYGEHEVVLEYPLTFFQGLLGLPLTKQIFVGTGGTVWFYKGSGCRAGTLKEAEICDVVERLRQQNLYKNLDSHR